MKQATNHIAKAVEVVNQGGIIIFPTDTAFGIGCRIDDEGAVARLFKLRNRPLDKATPVLVDTLKMAQRYVQPISQEIIDQLIEPYWPGALTIILPCIFTKVPELVRGGGSNLGIRIPNHPVARAIIRGVGCAMLGPSANFAGEKTPYVFSDLDPKLTALVDYVVPGICTVKQASTVIDCSVMPWNVLRQGAIQIETQKSKLKNQKYNLKIKSDITIFIDTASNSQISIGLRINNKKDMVMQKLDKNKAQVVLPMLEKLLQKHKIQYRDLAGIEVNTGPGSFTGLRVGISIANMLGYLLKIPINNTAIGAIVEPVYE